MPSPARLRSATIKDLSLIAVLILATIAGCRQPPAAPEPKPSEPPKPEKIALGPVPSELPRKEALR